MQTYNKKYNTNIKHSYTLGDFLVLKMYFSWGLLYRHLKKNKMRHLLFNSYSTQLKKISYNFEISCKEIRGDWTCFLNLIGKRKKRKKKAMSENILENI